MKRFEHSVKDPQGLHLRPAGLIAGIARLFPDTVILVSRGSREANAASLMRLMGLRVRSGDTVSVVCEGPSEMEAAIAMHNCFWNNL